MRRDVISLLATTALATLALASPALAAPAVDGEFDIPDGVGSNNEITMGPDGNMWVTRQNANGVARITPDGTVTAFPLANTAFGITIGPDGNIWASTVIGVAKIPPADPGAAESFNLGINEGRGITTGPDGNMWVVAGDQLVRFSTADPEGTDQATTITGMAGRGMATGSDGLLWIADQNGGVGDNGGVISATATDTPVTTPYAVGSGVQDVAAGPGAQIGYANAGEHEVGLISPGGTPQQIPLETSDPFGVAFGADGAYWVARSSTDDLLRMAPDGSTTTLTGFSDSGNVGPRKVAAGPNDTLWVTLDTQEKVARVTGVEPPPAANLETTIDKGPKRKLETERKAKAKFRFSASDPAASFECKLKRKRAKGGKRALRAAKFTACTSPKKYKLKPGKYTFSVRAVLGAAKDPTPAQSKFKVVRKR